MADDLPHDADDEAWTRGLAGRAKAVSADPAHREGIALREAMIALDDRRATAAGPAPSAESVWRAVQTRAARDAAPREPETTRLPWSRRLADRLKLSTRPSFLVSAATLAVACVVVIGMNRGPAASSDNVDAVRGAGQAVVIRAALPQAVEASMRSCLRAAGATVHPYAVTGGAGLDVDWPASSTSAVARCLAPWRVELPTAAREVQVTIVPPTGSSP